MVGFTTEPELRPAAVCRQCGQPLPSDTQLCRECAVQLAQSILLRGDRAHGWDLVLAVIGFAATSGMLIVLTGPDVLSLPAMLLRLVVLGVPFSLVMWKWYLLMHETDPDYGELWCIYWQAQFVTWSALIALYILIMTAVLIMMSFMLF